MTAPLFGSHVTLQNEGAQSVLEIPSTRPLGEIAKIPSTEVGAFVNVPLLQTPNWVATVPSSETPAGFPMSAILPMSTNVYDGIDADAALADVSTRTSAMHVANVARKPVRLQVPAVMPLHPARPCCALVIAPSSTVPCVLARYTDSQARAQTQGSEIRVSPGGRLARGWPDQPTPGSWR